MAKGEIRKKASPVHDELVTVKGTLIYSYLMNEDPEYGGYQVVLGNMSPEAIAKLEADGIVLKDIQGPVDAETGERTTWENTYQFKCTKAPYVKKEGVVVDREVQKFNPSSGSEVEVTYTLWDTNYKGKAMRRAYIVGVDVTDWIEYAGNPDGGDHPPAL
jgi:hypothetical protein